MLITPRQQRAYCMIAFVLLFHEALTETQISVSEVYSTIRSFLPWHFKTTAASEILMYSTKLEVWGPFFLFIDPNPWCVSFIFQEKKKNLVFFLNSGGFFLRLFAKKQISRLSKNWLMGDLFIWLIIKKKKESEWKQAHNSYPFLFIYIAVACMSICHALQPRYWHFAKHIQDT